MKRQDKITRFSIKKYSVGVASVAVAAFVFLGTDVKAADENATTQPTTEISTPTETSATTGVATTETSTNTNSDSTNTSATDKKESTETTATASTTPESNTSVTDAATTENKEEASTLAAENDSTTEGDATASNKETPTLANISESTNSNLVKAPNFNGEYGVNVSFKGKDDKEYTTTYGGASFVNLEKIGTTSPITATFTLKNDDQDRGINIFLLIPKYTTSSTSLVFDGSKVDKNKGIQLTSSLGNDYPSLLRYSNKGGAYLELEKYKSDNPDTAFTDSLIAFQLLGNLKANDTVSYSFNLKFKEQDAKDTPAQSASFRILDFINGHNGYDEGSGNLNVTFMHDEDINTTLLLDKQVIPAYRPSKGEDGGVDWEYAADIQQYMPTPDEIFRYGRVDNNVLPEDKLVSEKTEDGYYIVASGDERLKGFPNLSPYTYLLIPQVQKNISTHGYTANPALLQLGFYRYELEKSPNFVLNGINLDAEKEAGAKILHFQVIPSIILKEDQTYTVGKTNEATWDPKTMVKQFTDPNIVKWPVDENDSNQLDKSKLSVKITDITNSAEPKDVSSISLEKAGKYKVEYSYVFKDSSGADLPISNTGYVTVLTGKQKLVFNFVDKNDPANEVALFSSTVDGDSGAEVKPEVQSEIETKIAEYKQKGYKLTGEYEIPEKFDSTVNTVENVDADPQIVTINFVHDTEDQVENKDATLTIKYEGAGDKTPSAKVVTKEKAFSRTNVYDKVDKTVVKEGTWSPKSVTFDEVQTPEVKGYTPNKTSVKDEKATLENLNPSVTVTYTKDLNIVTTENKDVTRTITVTLPDGTKSEVEQKVTFVRTDSKDPATDEVTSTWDVEKQTLPAYTPKDYTGFTTKVEGSVAEVEVTPESSNLIATVSYESNPTVTNEEIPFKTKYEEDTTLDYGKTTEAVKGKVGTKKITISYKFENGNSVANDPTEEVVVAPVDRVIKVGTKPTVTTKSVAFETVYVADETLDYDKRVVKTEGANGEDTTTTTYKLVGDHAEENEATTARTKAPVNKVILVGTKPTSTTKDLAYTTTYEADDTLEAGQTKVKTAGKKGVETTTTTYKLDGNHAVVDKVGTAVTTPVVNEVISVGTKPTSVTKELAYKTIYKENPALALGEQKVVVAGKKGSEVTTTTYSVNTTTGEVTSSTKVDRVEAVDEVIEVGKKLNEEKHSYSYKFTSTSEGKELPKEVLDLAPQGGQYDATMALVPELPVKLEVETKDGKWTFVGYTPSEVLDFEDVVFVGEWKFTEKEKPVEPTKPTKPTKPTSEPQEENKPQNDNLSKEDQKVTAKEGKKLPKTDATDTSLPYASLGVLAVAAATLRKRKNTK